MLSPELFQYSEIMIEEEERKVDKEDNYMLFRSFIIEKSICWKRF